MRYFLPTVNDRTYPHSAQNWIVRMESPVRSAAADVVITLSSRSRFGKDRYSVIKVSFDKTSIGVDMSPPSNAQLALARLAILGNTVCNPGGMLQTVYECAKWTILIHRKMPQNIALDSNIISSNNRNETVK